ncbi:MAG: hypothetical protein XXXJIFNMEKO3_02856 [Candidatus Erwinia impunctatus]|nr:hypothetical protein XXXJIFNMEKO_02856 [Culicoides impunctatus]
MNNMMINKYLFRTAVAISFASMLAGCGLKGPLYFPESKPTPNSSSVTTTPTRSDAKTDNGVSGTASVHSVATQPTAAQTAQ